MFENKNLVIGLLIAFGLIGNGYFIGKSIERFRQEDRSISVKGFAEREVKADMAVWTIKTRITTNDLSEGSRTVEQAKSKITAFLLENGIKQEEIVQKVLSVNDRLAQEYGGENNIKFRYLIDNVMQVRSTNVEHIQSVSHKTDDLIKEGIISSNNQEYDPAVKFVFTGLNKIKPEMLSEATTNAMKAALEFTGKSQVHLGKMQRASQGFFTIVDRDAYLNSQSDGGGFESNLNDVYKKVRVVVNIEYSIY